MDTLEPSLSHEELLEVTASSLCTLIRTDPLLNDLPSDITAEEISWKIAVECGRSTTLILNRDEESPLKIIVPRKSSTVSSLKRAIRKHFEMYQKRKNDTTKISWRSVWRTHALECEGVTLDCDESPLSKYGVENKSTIAFVRRRNRRRHKN